jgi:hypothetical protein
MGGGGMEVQFREFLTSVVDGRGEVVSFTPLTRYDGRKRPPAPIGEETVWAQRRSGRCREERNL